MENPLDRYFCEDSLLSELAEVYGTPLLVYDARTLQERTRMIFRAFADFPGYRQFFPVQEMDHPRLLHLLSEEGCGFVCSNAQQLTLARLAGAKPDQLLFSACFPRDSDWDAAVDAGAVCILEDPEQLYKLSAEVYGKKVLGLRVQAELPGFSLIHGQEKFGMPPEAVIQTAIEAKKAGFSRLGLFMQSVCMVAKSGYFAKTAQYLTDLAEQVEKAAGLPIAWCDLGGGLCWDHDGRDFLDLKDEAKKIVPGKYPIHTQLGRYLAAPAGILLTTVQGQKGSLLGVDVSISDLPRAMLLGSRFYVSLVGDHRMEPRQSYRLAGPLMHRLDHFGGTHPLPPVHVGSLLAFHDVGVFSRSLASNFGGSLRCGIWLLEHDGPICICPQETQNQWLKGFGLAPNL